MQLHLISFIKRVIRYIKRRGIKAIPDYINNVQPKVDVFTFYDYIVDSNVIPLNIEEKNKHKDDEVKILNWIIPEAGVGSGGHIDIFRFASNLENMGFHSRMYTQKPMLQPTDDELRKFLFGNFEVLDKRIECFAGTEKMEFSHATIATSWTTAYVLKNFNNTISKFYFIQDFEPYFYAKGSEYQFSENTYKMDFRCITAGDWLKNKLEKEYGRKATSFSFSYDRSVYHPCQKKDDVNRIFFYARPVTPRRDFELGLLALEELSKRVDNLEVYFAGWDINNYEIPFKHVNLGILPVTELSEIYAQCDMCFVISATNLSLLPLEVMASNSVAVCTSGENSDWLVNDENSIIIENDPISIAEKLSYYFKHKDELDIIRKNGLEFADNTSWIAEAEKVKTALLKGIEEDAI